MSLPIATVPTASTWEPAVPELRQQGATKEEGIIFKKSLALTLQGESPVSTIEYSGNKEITGKI